MEVILFGVLAIVVLYVAFKVTKFVVSGCLKLVIFGVLAVLVAAAGWYFFYQHR